jgi:hypothetical protein
MNWQPREKMPQAERMYAIVCERYPFEDEAPLSPSGHDVRETTYNSSLDIALFENGEWHFWDDEEGKWMPSFSLFTHWMPVPKRPDL